MGLAFACPVCAGADARGASSWIRLEPYSRLPVAQAFPVPEDGLHWEGTWLTVEAPAGAVGLLRRRALRGLAVRVTPGWSDREWLSALGPFIAQTATMPVVWHGCLGAAPVVSTRAPLPTADGGPVEVVDQADRLGRAAMLLRDCEVLVDELPFDVTGALTQVDALHGAVLARTPSAWPLDLSSGRLELLARVPGVGRVAAGALRAVASSRGAVGGDELAGCGVDLRLARPWLLVDGAPIGPLFAAAAGS